MASEKVQNLIAYVHANGIRPDDAPIVARWVRKIMAQQSVDARTALIHVKDRFRLYGNAR